MIRLTNPGYILENNSIVQCLDAKVKANFTTRFCKKSYYELERKRHIFIKLSGSVYDSRILIRCKTGSAMPNLKD